MGRPHTKDIEARNPTATLESPIEPLALAHARACAIETLVSSFNAG